MEKSATTITRFHSLSIQNSMAIIYRVKNTLKIMERIVNVTRSHSLLFLSIQILKKGNHDKYHNKEKKSVSLTTPTLFFNPFNFTPTLFFNPFNFTPTLYPFKFHFLNLK